MPDPVTGVTAAVGIGGAVIGSKSASKASRAQVQAAEAGTAEQRAAREELRRLLQPYTSAGPQALQGMLDILGLGGSPGGTVDWAAYVQGNPDALANWNAIKDTSSGQQFGGDISKFGQYHYSADGSRRDLSPFTSQGVDAGDAQKRAISNIESSPIFGALARQGEDAILQNASATGGLRGGNVQGALAQFRPALLDRFISQYYDRLAGVTALGQQSAAGVGSAGIQTGTNIANLLGEAGAARAGNAVAQGDVWSRLLGGVGGIATNLLNKPAAQPGGF